MLRTAAATSMKNDAAHVRTERLLFSPSVPLISSGRSFSISLSLSHSLAHSFLLSFGRHLDCLCGLRDGEATMSRFGNDDGSSAGLGMVRCASQPRHTLMGFRFTTQFALLFWKRLPCGLSANLQFSLVRSSPPNSRRTSRLRFARGNSTTPRRT